MGDIAAADGIDCDIGSLMAPVRDGERAPSRLDVVTFNGWVAVVVLSISFLAVDSLASVITPFKAAWRTPSASELLASELGPLGPLPLP